jgi:hypothetical protein
MGIHLQISLAFELKVHDRVFREQRQHVIEKGDSRGNTRLAASINIQLEIDPCFLCSALDSRGPLGHKAQV